MLASREVLVLLVASPVWLVACASAPCSGCSVTDADVIVKVTGCSPPPGDDEQEAIGRVSNTASPVQRSRLRT